MNDNIKKLFSLNKISNYSKYFFNFFIGKNNKNNKQILDPLTTIIKIALLNFYDVGTKLSISNNSIEIQESNVLQGTIRWGNGSSRTNLHNLKEPIENCLNWFPHSKYNNLEIVYKNAISGLKKLQECYKQNVGDNNVNHLIEYYINIINSKLDNKEEIMEKSVILDNTIQRDIKKIWSVNDITLVNTYFKILEENNENEKIIKSIYEFLKNKDLTIQNYLKKYITEL